MSEELKACPCCGGFLDNVLTPLELRDAARAALEALAGCTLVYRDNGHVVHEMRGAPDDIWKTLLRAALEDDSRAGEG